VLREVDDTGTVRVGAVEGKFGVSVGEEERGEGVGAVVRR
jgi:hypothetical protein